VQVFDDGVERIFLPHLIPILDDAGGLSGVTVVLADATQLRQIDEAKSGLISTVSHELKTPLTSIQMCIHLALEETGMPPKQRELLEAAKEDSRRLGQIIESLLDIGRLQAGRAQFQFEPADVATLIEESAGPLSAAVAAGSLTVERALPPDLPQVLADRARIRHVFENIFSNAAKYTPAGGKVKIWAEAAERVVRIFISDTGVGIPAEYTGQIFERFVRVPQDGSVPGAGLGLTIAREVIEAHGGEISVVSKPGEGSTFMTTLRRADAV
jgi:signal transduction histidine kinase